MKDIKYFSFFFFCTRNNWVLSVFTVDFFVSLSFIFHALEADLGSGTWNYLKISNTIIWMTCHASLATNNFLFRRHVFLDIGVERRRILGSIPCEIVLQLHKLESCSTLMVQYTSNQVEVLFIKTIFDSVVTKSREKS